MLNPAKATSQSVINQAFSYLQRQKFAEAEQSLLDLIRHRGPEAAACLALSDVYAAQTGKEGHAVVAVVMASDADPANIDILEKFIARAGHIRVTEYDDATAAVMLRCFDHADQLDCNKLNVAWLTLVSAQPDILAAYDLARRQDFDSVNAIDFAEIKDLKPLLAPLFLQGLRHIVVYSEVFETFLTAVRKHLLLTRQEQNALGLDRAQRLILATALAHYAFYVDYVFCETAEETKALENIDFSDTLQVSVYASYRPLHAVAKINSDLVPELFAQQVQSRQKLEQALQKITPLTEIDSGMSLAVKAQYEEFPYPRWRMASVKNIAEGWNAMGRNADMTREVYRQAGTENIRILIAGCGTGLDALWVSTVFPKADILAIDLSLSSLSYAIAKAEEYKLSRVRFHQADILKLGTLNEKFDFILSGGVLHHLQDPEAGFRVLTGLLKPRGFMLVGLYSKIARSEVMSIQKLIKQKGYGSTAAEMRRFRADAAKILTPEMKQAVGRSVDYFHAPTCRDLLFHAQEHNYDLPEIEQILNRLALEFRSLVLKPNVQATFAKQFPKDQKGESLQNWNAFEMENKNTFIQMYLLWLQGAKT